MGHFGLLTANEEGIVRIPQTIMGGSGNLVSFLKTQANSFDSLPLPSPKQEIKTSTSLPLGCVRQDGVLPVLCWWWCLQVLILRFSNLVFNV